MLRIKTWDSEIASELDFCEVGMFHPFGYTLVIYVYNRECVRYETFRLVKMHPSHRITTPQKRLTYGPKPKPITDWRLEATTVFINPIGRLKLTCISHPDVLVVALSVLGGYQRLNISVCVNKGIWVLSQQVLTATPLLTSPVWIAFGHVFYTVVPVHTSALATEENKRKGLVVYALNCSHCVFRRMFNRIRP